VEHLPRCGAWQHTGRLLSIRITRQGTDTDVLIGMTDTPEIAAFIVDAANTSNRLLDEQIVAALAASRRALTATALAQRLCDAEVDEVHARLVALAHEGRVNRIGDLATNHLFRWTLPDKRPGGDGR
jgi:hypothetical protein